MNKWVTKIRRGEGFSLIEVLVAMGLFTILTIALIAIGVNALRVTSDINIRLDNANQGRSGITAASKVLRSTVSPVPRCNNCSTSPVYYADPTELVFYSTAISGTDIPYLTYLYLQADPNNPALGRLMELYLVPTVYANGSYTYCVGGCSYNSRVIANGLPNLTYLMFSYFDYNGNPLTSTPLSAYDLSVVTSVDVNLTIQTVPGQKATPASTTIERIRLSDINRPLSN